MKLLKDILYRADLIEVKGSTNIAIDQMTFDSRQVTSYSLFVAIGGTQVDGHAFIEAALDKGAIAIVCETFPEELRENVAYIQVTDSGRALGVMASNFFDNPSSKLKLVGITGTNGKTTTATMLYNMFRGMGRKTGLLSTVVNRIHNEEIEATHTTPDALSLNKLLVEMLEKGCTHCFMEVSSHAVHQNRVAGLEFAGGIFTNITHDHLDYHGSFNEYIKAKKGFFDQLPEDAFALVNRDDTHWETMLLDTAAFKHTFGIHTVADFKARIIENRFEGLQLNVDGKELWSKLIGSFNAYNILSVYAASVLLGEDAVDVLTTISTLNPVEGRFEYIKTAQDITAIVDYAHTPDALENVLKTIRDIRSGDEQVISVVGCGGDRDKSKRPKMGRIACDLSDRIVFTSDNPRGEDPNTILQDMQAGMEDGHKKKTMSIVDRKEAIHVACQLAQTGDIVLIAGKGHEKYQEIKGERFPFDDMEIVGEILKLLEK